MNKLEAISFGFGFARTHGGCHRLAKHVYNSSPTSTIRSSRADAVNWATIIDLSYELPTQRRRRHIIIETNFFTKFCFISNRSHTQHTHRRWEAISTVNVYHTLLCAALVPNVCVVWHNIDFTFQLTQHYPPSSSAMVARASHTCIVLVYNSIILLKLINLSFELEDWAKGRKLINLHAMPLVESSLTAAYFSITRTRVGWVNIYSIFSVVTKMLSRRRCQGDLETNCKEIKDAMSHHKGL